MQVRHRTRFDIPEDSIVVIRIHGRSGANFAVIEGGKFSASEKLPGVAEAIDSDDAVSRVRKVLDEMLVNK